MTTTTTAVISPMVEMDDESVAASINVAASAYGGGEKAEDGYDSGPVVEPYNDRAHLESDYRYKKYLIEPNGRFRKNWDMLVVFALAFTATVTPFEVAFLESTLGVLFGINRVVDVTFLIDTIANFFTPVMDTKTGLWCVVSSRVRVGAEGGGGGKKKKKTRGLTTLVGEFDAYVIRVTSHRGITLRYLQFWFWIDVVSLIPFDAIGVASNSGSVANLQGLRLSELLVVIING